jgi:DNA helicase-2/ATP-dependent DNA helicase PcrA
MRGESLLAGLNQAQMEAVTTAGAPVVVMAGAGSGKTRVLTRRIAWRVVDDQTDPNRVLALTFTRKAATELRQRLRALGLRDQVTAATFHATALLQLRQRWAERSVVPPTLLDHRTRFVARLLPRSPKVNPADVVTEIDWARARVVAPEHYGAAAPEAGRTPPLPAEAMAEIMVRYQQEKRQRRLVDFDDLLMLAIRDLRADTVYAEAVRWRYRHLYVDEFQDVNPLQYELLSEWRGRSDDLFVVGDPNQAIYGWNGADPNLLARFVRREPSATVIELTTNYRSTPQVLAVAAALTNAPPLAAERAEGPAPTITAYPDDEAEAAGIALRVRAARSVAGSWSDQAVLVRTNAQLLGVEQALRDAGVPTRLRGGSGPLATPEVRAELRRLGEMEVNLDLAVSELNERLADDVDDLTVAEIERRANLGAFARLVNDYLTTDTSPSGPGLVAWLATLQAGDVDTEVDAVELATFHGAKGLEWPVVHVAGLEEGFVPIAYASTGAQLAEERRLLYVAVTRAEEELHLSWAAERTFTNRAVKRQPSPHLGALAAAIDRLGVAPAHRVDWRAQLANSRHQLELSTGAMAGSAPGADTDGGSPSTGPDDDAVYRALRSWRQRRARAADVPGHALFSDQTLRAIASARPRSKAALAGLPGMRAAKLERYADDLLRLLAEQGAH